MLLPESFYTPEAIEAGRAGLILILAAIIACELWRRRLERRPRSPREPDPDYWADLTGPRA